MYTRTQNLINGAFLGFFFLAPVAAVYVFPTWMDTGDVQAIVAWWLLAAMMWGDWYFWKLTNTLRGCLRCTALGGAMALGAVALTYYSNHGGVAAILEFPEPDWPGHRWVLKIFVVGAALAAVAVVSIPRLFLLRLAGWRGEAPAAEDPLADPQGTGRPTGWDS